MSAFSCLAFYGIRFDVSRSEIESLEERSHPYLASARKAGLAFYWANFGAPGEKYFLFVGRTLGMLGVEDAHELRFPTDDLGVMMDHTRSKLRSAGFPDAAALYLQFIPDA